MSSKSESSSQPMLPSIDGALATMSTEELRKLVRSLLLELDEKAYRRVVSHLIDQAARGPGWTPKGPSSGRVGEIVSFAEAAMSVGCADPSDVDDYLREGSDAFLSKDYLAASEIFRALLLPMTAGEIDLGEHETVDEVLGVDVDACAVQYVVSRYRVALPEDRAEAVRSAIAEVEPFWYFPEPLREMERASVEPLPDFDDFARRWRALLEQSFRGETTSSWDGNEDRWLREVVGRMEGAEGLAKIARSTRRASDLQAWCRMLAEARDWEAALPAYEEAAEILVDEVSTRGELFDGAALAARELGHEDFPARLERAWREAPSLLRLERWLATADSKAALRKRTAQALEACSENASRQRALLHVLLGDVESAADLLARAPGLGWSDREHPGHFLFAVFGKLLTDSSLTSAMDLRASSIRGMDVYELEWMTADPDKPRLTEPDIHEIFETAGTHRSTGTGERKAMLRAMRKAAEKRIAGVTKKKRRRLYGHAAELVATCSTLDPTPESATWVAGIRADYRRFPALQRELDNHLGGV